MSMYVSIITEFYDMGMLITALKEIGHGKVEVGKGIEMYDYMGKKRDTADIVIRRKYLSNLSNDIGFKFDGKKHELRISEYDVNTGKFPISELKQKYTMLKLAKELIGNRYTVIKKTKSSNNTIELLVKRFK